MCGIVGSLSSLPSREFLGVLDRMTDALLHRGPDARGVFTAEGARHLGLGHRRLSILDLSPSGAQPMQSARYVLTFNGEIYNHLDLRKELMSAGYSGSFRGTSDTETLLAGFEHWGFTPTLERAAGMFALGLWDKQDRKLLLARDRMGEKPLYYGTAGKDFIFGSEIKALRAHPACSRDIDREALKLFLTLGYIPAPFSIYRGIQKLPPAHWLAVNEDGSHSPPIPYWNLPEVARKGMHSPLSEQPDDEFEALLAKVVREQKISDVPLGCFLSGGIDSSLVASLMGSNGGPRTRTFSIGFADGGFDESAFASEIAEKLGTEHMALQATPADALAVVPELPKIYDEPFADASQIPSILLARLARPHVTVALTGDGGDEVFAGYNRYLFLERARRIPRLAAPALRLAATLAGSSSLGGLPQLDEKLRKLAAVARAGTESAAYWTLAAQGLLEPRAYDPVEKHCAQLQGVPGLQLRDQLLYLPDDILVKVDRAAMSASLETRAPFLDHRVVEMAWRLPLRARTQGNQGKLVLRRLLARRLDPALWQRPKAGFSPPLGFWLCGSLRSWADELLSDQALAATELPGADQVKVAWSYCKSSGGSGALRLWPALMAQAWLRES